MSLIPTQEEAKAESLVPPRPNLGPEPWPEPTRWPGPAGWSGLAALVVVFGVGLRLRNLHRSLRKVSESLNSSIVADGLGASPRERLISNSEQVRDALIRTFGPSWGSKTTEEISQGAGLVERLDPAELGRLIEFLKLADRAKFAEAALETEEDWEAWSSGIVAQLSAPKRPPIT